jgi:hypothetical protein
MKPHHAAVVALLALVSAACSSAATPERGAPVPVAAGGGTTTTATSGDDDDGSDVDAGSADGGGRGASGDSGAALDWQDLYSLYFAPGTDGHCAQCHGVALGLAGFSAGSTADSLYEGLIAANLVDATDPAGSPIGIAGKSPLSWYDIPASGKATLSGLMPADQAVANAAAAAAVTQWVASGAQNHGVGPGGQANNGGGDAGAADSGAKDGGTHDAGSDGGAGKDGGPSPAGTFTDVYENWIGPGTAGSCSASFCHNLGTSKGAEASGFVCGSTQAGCYAGLVKKGLIDPSDPSSSLLGIPGSSPLGWFGNGGPMPEGDSAPNAAGAAAISAWIAAGARND